MSYQNSEFANQMVGFYLYASNKLFDQSLAASRKVFEQTQEYVQSLKSASSVEDFVKVSEKAGKQGSKLAEDYLRDAYAVVGETASQFANRQSKAVADALDKVPASPYSDFIRQAVFNQFEAYKAVIDSYSKPNKQSAGSSRSARSKQ